MGLTFDISNANWVAHLLQPDGVVPYMEPGRESEIVKKVLNEMRDSFVSASTSCENHFVGAVNRTIMMLDEKGINNISSPSVLKEIREFLGNKPWTSLIIPSGRNDALDGFLCNKKLLRFIVEISPDDPGIILQLEEAPKVGFSLLNIFPAFTTALSESNQWPGILVWDRSNNSIFLPFATEQQEEIRNRLRWIFTNKATSIGNDLEVLKGEYLKEFPEARVDNKSNLHFIHLSDLHIGSKEANIRLPRVQQFVRNLVEELEPSGDIVPIITGDLMDSPTKNNSQSTRAFIDFIANIGQKGYLAVLGNHDVRKGGLFTRNYTNAMRLRVNSGTAWYDDYNIGVICINSVMRGALARGVVEEEQLLDIGSEIEAKNNWKDFTLLAAMHHHPVPVDIPGWYDIPFYEKILGGQFQKTDALVGSDSVMGFMKDRNVAAILHGHKHIPRAELLNERIAVIGCGSSVGKVTTADGGTYMSVNVVSVDGRSRKVTSRLLAERAPGGGLKEQKRHEFVLRS